MGLSDALLHKNQSCRAIVETRCIARRYGAILAKSRTQLGHILQRNIAAHMFICIKQFFCPTFLDGNWQYLATKVCTQLLL